MKSVCRKIFVVLFTAVFTSMFTGCFILLDEEFWSEYETSRTKVIVKNECSKYGADAAYVYEVAVRTSASEEWKASWSCENYSEPLYADNNCKFYVNNGRYYFRVRIVYPNLSSRYDYYEDFITEGRIACAEGETLYLYFDGDNLYTD